MLDNRHEYVDGHFVSQRISQVVQAIKEYANDVEVQWIPPGDRAEGDSAFRLVHCPEGREPYVIFHVKTEEEFDARVLKQLIMGDQRLGEASISEIEASELAAKRVAHQRFLDQMQEANELASSVFRSNKDTYKVNDNLIISQTKKGNQAVKPRHFT